METLWDHACHLLEPPHGAGRAFPANTPPMSTSKRTDILRAHALASCSLMLLSYLMITDPFAVSHLRIGAPYKRLTRGQPVLGSHNQISLLARNRLLAPPQAIPARASRSIRWESENPPLLQPIPSLRFQGAHAFKNLYTCLADFESEELH